MTDFDHISRAIGNIEGKLDAIEKSQMAQWDKLEGIERTLTNHRLKVVGLTALVSTALTSVYHFFKGN